MKKITGSVFLLLAASVAACCAPGSKKLVSVYPFEKEAIDLSIRSDAQLNVFEGIPHALRLCVYGLGEVGGFTNLLAREDGLPRLLACEKFDASVLMAENLYLQPGGRRRAVFDRAEGVRHLAFVAGYFVQNEKADLYRLIPVPTAEEQKDRCTTSVQPVPAVIDLDLGPLTIRQVVVN